MIKAPPAGVRQVALLGLMGAGKTTVGRLLAARLGWPLRDSDVELEARTGTTVREIRAARGTAALHRVEARTLLRALAQDQPGVVCAAASTIDNGAARQALGAPGIALIWLTAAPAVLAGRFANDAHRPVFGPDPLAVAQAQAARRNPRYAALDPITIDVEGRSPDDVAGLALAGLGARFGRFA